MSQNFLKAVGEDAIFVVAGVLRSTRSTTTVNVNQVLIVRRGPHQSGAGAWEFPGGKVDAGESPEAALRREIREELGIEIEVGDLLGEEVHSYPDKKIRLRVYLATTSDAVLSLHEHDASQWLLPEQIDVALLSAADRPFVQKLIQHLRK